MKEHIMKLLSGLRILGIAVLAAALSIAAPALAADTVTGTWTLEVKTSQGTAKTSPAPTRDGSASLRSPARSRAIR
jgi:hypothetical protein